MKYLCFFSQYKSPCFQLITAAVVHQIFFFITAPLLSLILSSLIFTPQVDRGETQSARGPGTARTLATRVQSLPAVQLAPPNNQGESLLARGAMGLGLALPPPIVCLGPGAARQAGWGWGATVGAWGCKQIHPGQPDSRLNYFLTCRGNRIDQINSGRNLTYGVFTWWPYYD